MVVPGAKPGDFIAINGYRLDECAPESPHRLRLSSLTVEPTESSGSPRRPEHFARDGERPHRSSMRRISVVAAAGDVSMRRLLVGMMTKTV